MVSGVLTSDTTGKLASPAAWQEQEERWIRASQSGDRAAFNRLVMKWERTVFNLALRMIRNPEDAAEVSQEVFLAAFRHIRRFRGQSRFSTWLYRIASNKCLTFRRKASTRREFSIDDEESAGWAGSLAASETPGRHYQDVERREKILSALARLHPDQRIVVELKIFQELTFDSIAEVLEVPESTVKSRFYTSLGVLKGHLSVFAPQRVEE